MTAPYDHGAPLYLEGGLWPIPVFGKNTPVKYATGYDGTVTPEKVRGWLETDLTQRARNGRGSRMDNLAIRHQLTVAIDIDDGYGSKSGVVKVREYAEKKGLPPLPATWSSTARGNDSPSRQHLYRIEDDVPMKTKPCESVEVCCWHHRFTVCWPSIHPNGNTYTWYEPGEAGVPPTWGSASSRPPRADEITPLPAEWYRAFTGTVANADRSVETVDVSEFVAKLPQGEPDGLVQFLIEKWSDETQHVGHDEAKNALINAFMVGREGHPGAGELVKVIVGRFTSYLEESRPKEAHREVFGSGGNPGLLQACADIAQQKPVKPAGPTIIGRLPTPAEFMAGAEVAAGTLPYDQQAPSVEPADDETWAAFVATFTTPTGEHMADRRAGWLRDDLIRRPADRYQVYARHALKAFTDVIHGRYSAERAVELLTDTAPPEVGEHTEITLRVCLTAALSNMEGAAQ